MSLVAKFDHASPRKIAKQKKPVLSELFDSYYTVGLMVSGAIFGAWR